MSDTFTPYEVGLKQLLEHLGDDHYLYAEALVYQQRLRENIAQTRKYGDTETRRAERAQILDRLNQLALQTLGMSFNDLCQAQSAPSRQDSSSPQRRPRPGFVRVKGTAPVYKITSDGNRRWVPDGPTVESLGSWDQVETLASIEELKRFPPERPIPSVTHGERPWLVRIHSEPETFLIDDEGNRHYVPDGATLDAIIDDKGGVDQLVDWEELERFPRGDPFPGVMSETPSIPGMESPVNLAQAQRLGRVFISHSSKDRDFVIRLASDLEEAGHSVWYAEWEIKVGDSIVQRINEGLAESSYLLVVLSPDSVKSRWVQQELNTALMEQLSRQDVTVLPVLWRSCEIPALLCDIKYADFREGYNTGLQELLDVLEREPSLQRHGLPGRRRPIRDVRAVLRDNIWQGIGAIVAILALLVTLWTVFRPADRPTVETPTTQVTKQATTASNNPVGAVSPTLPAVPTPEPLGIQYLVFDPPPPSAAETITVFACTTGYGGEGITLKVSVNTAPDGSDKGEWQVLKELGVPCFNQTDVPTWNTQEWQVGTYLVKVEAKGSDDPEWERAAVLTATYSLLEIATTTPTPGIGSTKTREIDGAVVVYVPAGEFLMGSTDGEVDKFTSLCNEECQRSDFEDEMPQHTVLVDAFWIDEVEVTNRQYRICVQGGICQSSQFSNDANLNGDDQPAVGVSWQDALTYCNWAGSRLPTEAEWEKAARGTDGQLYPWGDAFKDLVINYGHLYQYTVPVKTLDNASPYGAYDMVGNVWEWTSSRYYGYPYKADDGREDSEHSDLRVIRGGAWVNEPGFVHATSRSGESVDHRYGRIGFRCAESAISN